MGTQPIVALGCLPWGDERHSTPSGAGAKSSKRKKVKQGMQQLIPPGKSPCREEGQHLWVLQAHHNLNLIPGPSKPRRATKGREKAEPVGVLFQEGGQSDKEQSQRKEEEVLPARRKSRMPSQHRGDNPASPWGSASLLQ